MRASALQIIRQEEASRLIPADERCNAVEGFAAVDYIPPNWTGPHVGHRLIEAFKTLARMPGLHFANGSGYWPAYHYDWADLLAQQEMEKDEREKRDRDINNRVRIPPTAVDVSRMEIAIGWPAHYLRSRPLILRIVQRVAVLKSRDSELDSIARRLRKNPYYVRRINRLGLDIIALGLHSDGLAVF